MDWFLYDNGLRFERANLPTKYLSTWSSEVTKSKIPMVCNPEWPNKTYKKLHKKWSFPLSISSVNVTKSAENCGLGHIYWINP